MRVLEPLDMLEMPPFRVRQGIGGAPKRTVQGLEPVLVPEDEVRDEEGRFYTGDTVRRVHKGEHTLNVNHPRSQDTLASGMERALDPVIAKRGGSLGHTTINNYIELRGGVVLDNRAMEKFVDQLEDYQRRRRSYGRGGK